MWRETWWGFFFFFVSPPTSVSVPNILTTLSELFFICAIYLEWTFRLAATKESIVLPKKIKSYAAMSFCKSVGVSQPLYQFDHSISVFKWKWTLLTSVHVTGWMSGGQRAAWGCVHRGKLVQSCPNVSGSACRSHWSRCRYFFFTFLVD